ncbi:MAG: 50S ribosomal protein L24 [Chloroflexota bacterium]
MKIKKGDTVEVITGNDKGVRGEVRTVFPESRRVVVSGVRIVKRHQRRTGNARAQAGIIEREAPINACNVALVCPHCDKPTRVGYSVAADGSKARICRHCQEVIE